MASRRNEESSLEERFTAHQLLILELWAEKQSIIDVAHEMGVSKNTIATQLGRLRRRLGVNKTFLVYKFVKDRGMID